MPKGIYPRGNRSAAPQVVPAPSQNFENLGQGMQTQYVEAPVTPETANANVVTVVQQAGDDAEMSTTQRLFGDLLETEPEKEVPQSPAEVKEPEPEKVTPQNPPTPPVEGEDATFDIEKVLNKKVKAKIDGKEEEVTLKELRDNYQINKHLAQAADKVGEERRKLAEERRQLQELRQQRQGQYEIPNQQSSQQQKWNSNIVPQYESQQPTENYRYLQRLQFLESQFQQLAQGAQPAIYQSNRQRVADELKGQGFNDFLQYIPKMEAHLTGVQDPQLVQFYDTPQGSKALYFQLKAQDMNQARTPAPQAPAPIQNVVPPATRVDSGSQPSGSTNDDGRTAYRRAFQRAVDLGNDTALGKEAWNQLLSQKGILPGD